jgi:hypothetical protein
MEGRVKSDGSRLGRSAAQLARHRHHPVDTYGQHETFVVVGVLADEIHPAGSPGCGQRAFQPEAATGQVDRLGGRSR